MAEQVKTKNTKKSNIINISIIAIIFIGLLIYMLCVDGWENIVNVMKNINVWWLSGGLLCMCVFWIMEGVCLHIPTKKIYPNQRFTQSLRVSMIGQLFNSITPFSSGGQPMQAYEMTREGKKLSDSLSILLVKFIVFQTTLVLYTAVVLVFQLDFFFGLIQNFAVIAIIGFAINVLVIGFLILIGVNENAVFAMINPFYRLLSKIRLLKNLDAKLEKLKESISTFHDQFQVIIKEKKMLLKMSLYSIIQHTAYYCVTYMIYRAMGNSGVSIFNIIPAQAFLMMVMAFTPVPGAGIAAEGGFLLIFNTLFKKGTINMAILIWRMFTFYLPIVIGALFLIRIKKKDKKETIPEKVQLE